MFPRGRDPALQVVVFAFECPDPEPGLGQLGTGVAALPFADALRQFGFGPLAARPPRGELLLDRGEELFQLLQDRPISSCVG